jgi:hypothetical protein
MIQFRRNSLLFGFTVTWVVLLSLIGISTSASGKDIPIWFNYKINPGVIVDGTPMTYVPLGKVYGIKYTIDNADHSGPGTMTFRMYSDGALAWSQNVNVTANGTFTKMEPAPKFLTSEKNFGPFYLCVTSKTATGAKDVRSPCSKWSWIAIEVPITSVSKGCAGETGIQFLKKAESGWVDKQIINGVTFDFRDACNVLDAAYSGLTVKDSITNKVMDFTHWGRTTIDLYFQFDLQMICMQTISTSKASEIKKGEMTTSCNSWATRYYKALRQVGLNFFDANPAKTGLQTSYVEPNVILGLPGSVGRNNS